MERWVQDVRYSVRALRVAPVVSMAAVLSLALAIGATTGIFSVVDGVLLKPFPVKAQDRLLVVWTSKPERGFAHWPFSYAGTRACASVCGRPAEWAPIPTPVC